MTRRFLMVMAVALGLQGTVFAIYYDDLLFLRQPASRVTAGPVESFDRHARAALARPRLTVKHLDTVAAGARAFSLHEVEVDALRRRVDVTPDDVRARLRLADALRRAGRLTDAETIYLDLIAVSGSDRP